MTSTEVASVPLSVPWRATHAMIADALAAAGLPAADEAIAIAREPGAAWVGVRRSNHAGPAGLYAEMPAAQGMIALYAAVANANHMAAWGGAEHLLGTNPLAIAVP